MIQVIPKWRAIIWPFQHYVWAATIASVLAFSASLYLITNALKNTKRFSLYVCLLTATVCLCNQGKRNCIYFYSELFCSIFCFDMICIRSSILAAGLGAKIASAPLGVFIDGARARYD